MDCIVDYFTFSAVYFLAVVIVLAKPLKPTFKSYLLPVQTDLKKAPQPPIKKLEAKLLPGDPYIPLYVVGALFFSCLFVTAIVIVMMKNTKISQESHTLRMKREQDGEETLNSDCSPYAEGRGEDEGLFSLLKLTEVRDPVTAQNGAEEHAAVAVEQYSVVMLNTEYEASDPQATQTSSTCPLRIGAKI
ncbi:uncharacterized protein ACWYII_036833 isoform 4-T4 [Salvelinus alpinus]